MHKSLILLALVGSIIASAFGQSYSWSTIAGLPLLKGSVDGAGSEARFYAPTAAAVDRSGNVYVADTLNFTIRKITAAGQVSTLAGRPGVAGSNDGVGSAARFSSPFAVAVDADGFVYTTDSSNSTVRKISPAGVVTTLAGAAGVVGSADGTGGAARFSVPFGIAVDASGNVFVADRGNHTVRKITAAGVVSTVAGSPGVWGSVDGVGAAVRFNAPTGLALDLAGNLYVADSASFVIRKISPVGVVTTLAGMAGNSGSANGNGAAARFSAANGVAVDEQGVVYVADTGNDSIRQITPGGTVSNLAGGVLPGSVDGNGLYARFFRPYGLAIDVAGNIYVADSSNHSIRKISPAGDTTTLAGAGGNCGSTDGEGRGARFYFPLGIAIDAAGALVISDTYNGTIRKISASGVVSTIAGVAGALSYRDGPVGTARFGYPMGVGFESTSGAIYVVDDVYNAVRRISSAGVVTTYAGVPDLTGGSVDGAASTARFSLPRGLAIDHAGNCYVADSANHTIRQISVAGVVRTIAGRAGVAGSANGTGSAARFNAPTGVAVDVAGNVFVADTGNSLVRKITPDGSVSTVAGAAGVSGHIDGAGDLARFSGPWGIAVDRAGDLFVADTNNQTVRKITPAGIVSTIGGLAGSFDTVDGTGANARFGFPAAIAVDASGVLYVVNQNGNTVVKGVLDAMPRIALQPETLGVTTGAPVTFNVTASGGGLSYQWSVNGVPIAGATASSYTLSAAQAANGGNYTVAVTNSAGAIVSNVAALQVIPEVDSGRISNFAIRSRVGAGSQTLIVGFAIGGAATSGPKPILVRGVGPALGVFGLTGFLIDPKLEIYAGATGTKINENDNWAGDALIAGASARTGAFSLGAGTSRDAALFLPAFTPGSFTVQISGAGNETGIALAEIYDTTVATEYTAATPRLVNVSARTQVGTGGDVLIAGFYIAGRTAKTVLIRAIGPTLGVFGVTGVLADPKLELFSGVTRIDENDNWGGDATLAAIARSVGAFALAPGSADAALVVTLPPGPYTAQISGVGASVGVALVEVYEVP